MLFGNYLEFFAPITIITIIAVSAFKKLFQSKNALTLFKLPPYSMYYFAFLLFFYLSTFWSKNKELSFLYLKHFSSGYFFWFSAYNLHSAFRKFEIVLILIGLWYGILTILNIFFGDVNNTESLSLFLYAVPPLHHHHIGDLWVLVLIALGLRFQPLSKMTLMKNSKSKFLNSKQIQNYKSQLSNFHLSSLISHLSFLKSLPITYYLQPTTLILLIIFGFYLLLLSLSRSAYVALIAGSIFVLWKSAVKNNKSPIFPYKLQTTTYILFYLYILLSTILFLYAGTQKSTLAAHGGYVVQGVESFFRNPLGLGFGNFNLARKDIDLFSFRFEGGSSSAHNIIIEVFSGMGMLGFSFIVFLYKVIKNSIFAVKVKVGILYKILFITLFTNFLFDYTYLIPLMFWLWFIFLGKLQQVKNEKSQNTTH